MNSDGEESDGTAIPDYVDSLEFRIEKRHAQFRYMKRCIVLFANSTSNLPLLFELWNLAKEEPVYLKEFDVFFENIVKEFRRSVLESDRILDR